MGETVITDMVHHKLLKTVWISNRHSYAVGGNLTTNDVFRHLTVFTPAEWKRCCGLEIKSKQSEPHPLKSFTTLNFSFLFFFFFLSVAVSCSFYTASLTLTHQGLHGGPGLLQAHNWLWTCCLIECLMKRVWAQAIKDGAQRCGQPKPALSHHRQSRPDTFTPVTSRGPGLPGQ